jgi:hypothetical protein
MGSGRHAREQERHAKRRHWPCEESEGAPASDYEVASAVSAEGGRIKDRYVPCLRSLEPELRRKRLLAARTLRGALHAPRCDPARALG